MWTKIFKHQEWHLVLLCVILFLLYYVTDADPIILTGSLWKISTLKWLELAVLSPIIHQFYVLICWRSELHFKTITSLFGKQGFQFYKIGFISLILTRPITITILSFSNSMTANLNPYIIYTLSGIIIIPAIYLFYSLKKYFGIDRAFGIDHFYPDRYKDVPIVRQGIFKYTSNGMYVYGFLILWIPGLLLQSKAALLMALFNHVYIWVHYYFTELPDMNIIYQKDRGELNNTD